MQTAQPSSLPSSVQPSMPSTKSPSQSTSDPSSQQPTQNSAQPSSLPNAAKSVHQACSQSAGLLDFLSSIPSPETNNDVFDPENVGADKSDIETDSDEGQSIFRCKALSVAKECDVPMVRTRSETSSQNVEKVGKLVFAHKGKTVPFWFPGKVTKKTNKGYEVEFLTYFGTEECTEKNIMLREDYLLKKNDSSSLFKVPAKHRTSFEEAMKQLKEATNE